METQQFPGFVVQDNSGLTIQQQFERFHESNPWVMDRLLGLARTLIDRGHKSIGIGMLWEVLRWDYYMQTTDASGWKLNNNYRSRYARLICELHPEMADFFEMRRLRAE